MRTLIFGALAVLGLAVAIQNRIVVADVKDAKPETADAQHSAAAPSVQSGNLIQSIKGPDLFRAYCASCHGMDAKGGGPMLSSLKVKPADLTRISERNYGVFPRARMERIISGEEQPALGHGSSSMPVWGPVFSQVTTDVDLGRVRIDNLARYLETIQAK